MGDRAMLGNWAGKRSVRALVMGCLLGGALLGSSGCRLDDGDVHEWARKSSGPRKLVAVVQHDKYPLELRVEAAVTLVTMKPRGGRAVGLLGGDDFIGLLDALARLPAEERARIVDGMAPALASGMKLPAGPDGDPTFAYKDGAFALLTQEDGALVTSAETRKLLSAALVSWCQTNFEQRMDDTTQLYGVEQVLRLVRADGVRGLPPLLVPDFKKLREVSKLIRELGDDATRLDASRRLVDVATFVNSPKWTEAKSAAVDRANKQSGLKVTDKQFQKQVEAYQEEELLRVFGAMKFVGKAPVVDYLVAYATSTQNSEKRRAAALAALENNLDPQNAAQAGTMLDLLASDSTPDSIRDVAARRVGELSRERVAARLLELFSNKRWQVRWTAASLLLKMSEAKHLDEFMARLGTLREMALTEPLAYGPLLAEVKGAAPRELAEKYAAASYPAPARISALGYYYQFGTKADVARLEALRGDATKLPSCPKDAEGCAWECGVTEGDKQVAKPVDTLGRYVEYCLLPAASSREPEAPAKPNP